MCCVLGEVPLTGQKRVRGSNQCISGGGTPNRCPDTDSHAILRHSFFLTIGAKLIVAHSAHGLSLCLSPAFRKKISRQDGLQTTIANSVDPTTSPFAPPHAHFPFPKYIAP